MNYSIPVRNKFINPFKIILVIIISWYMYYYTNTISEWHFIDNVNLIFHEAGHIVFIMFGDLIRTLGGGLMQIIIPSVFSFYFFKNKNNFSASLLLFWLGQNLLNISVYAGDAINMDLPLLGGDNVYHDWNHLLSSINMLNYTEQIASFLYITGIVIFIIAFIYSTRYSISDNYLSKY